MTSLAYATPLLPGGGPRLRQLSAALLDPLREESNALQRWLGTSVERWYLQRGPACDIAIVYLEAPDSDQIMRRLAAARAPFARWYKERLHEAHGIDLNQPPRAPLPVQIFDWSEATSGAD